MGVSVGFGVGPVRVSKRLGGGRRSTGPGLITLVSKEIQRTQKEAERARAAEDKAQAAARFESAARQVVNGARQPRVVVDYLEGKAHRSRSVERQQFIRNQAVMIRSGYGFEVTVSPSGTVTVKVLDSKRAPDANQSDDFGPNTEQSLAWRIVRGDHSERTVARYLAHRGDKNAMAARERILAGADFTVIAQSASKVQIRVHGDRSPAIDAGAEPADRGPRFPGPNRAVIIAALASFVAFTLIGFVGAGGLAQPTIGEGLGMLLGSIIVGAFFAGSVAGIAVLIQFALWQDSTRRRQRNAEARARRIAALERELGLS